MGTLLSGIESLVESPPVGDRPDEPKKRVPSLSSGIEHLIETPAATWKPTGKIYTDSDLKAGKIAHPMLAGIQHLTEPAKPPTIPSISPQDAPRGGDVPKPGALPARLTGQAPAPGAAVLPETKKTIYDHLADLLGMSPAARTEREEPPQPVTLPELPAEATTAGALRPPKPPKTRHEIIKRIDQLNQATRILAPNGRLDGEVPAALFQAHIKPERDELAAKLNKMPHPLDRHMQPSTKGIPEDKLDQAIRGFEQLKDFARQDNVSDSDRKKALDQAREIGGQLKKVGYEVGDTGGWPYVKATKEAPFYPKDLGAAFRGATVTAEGVEAPKPNISNINAIISGLKTGPVTRGAGAAAKVLGVPTSMPDVTNFIKEASPWAGAKRTVDSIKNGRYIEAARDAVSTLLPQMEQGKHIGEAQYSELKKAYDQWEAEGGTDTPSLQVMEHVAAGLVPVVGPAGETAINQYREGKYPEAVGTTIGILALVFGPKAIRGLKEREAVAVPEAEIMAEPGGGPASTRALLESELRTGDIEAGATRADVRVGEALARARDALRQGELRGVTAPEIDAVEADVRELERVAKGGAPGYKGDAEYAAEIKRAVYELPDLDLAERQAFADQLTGTDIARDEAILKAARDLSGQRLGGRGGGGAAARGAGRGPTIPETAIQRTVQYQTVDGGGTVTTRYIDSPVLRTDTASVDSILETLQKRGGEATSNELLADVADHMRRQNIVGELGEQTGKPVNLNIAKAKIQDLYQSAATRLGITEPLPEKAVNKAAAALLTSRGKEKPSAKQARPSGALRPEVTAAEEKAPEITKVEAKPEEKVTYDYSSTQTNLPLTARPVQKILAFGKQIPDNMLAEDGREETPHITVKYGLHGEDPAEVQKLLADEGPITVTLGKTSVFPAATTGQPYDVVKVDVESPDLHRLNAKIADALPHTDTFPTYEPHITVAYVKPGEGQKYADKEFVEGMKLTLPSIHFSSKSGELTEIPLKGEKPRAEIKGTPIQREGGPPGETYRGVGARPGDVAATGEISGIRDRGEAGGREEEPQGQAVAPTSKAAAKVAEIQARRKAEKAAKVAKAQEVIEKKRAEKAAGAESKYQVAKARKAEQREKDDFFAAQGYEKVGIGGGYGNFIPIGKGGAQKLSALSPEAVERMWSEEKAKRAAKPVIPQVPPEPGTKYVLPSFVTGGQPRKTKAPVIKGPTATRPTTPGKESRRAKLEALKTLMGETPLAEMGPRGWEAARTEVRTYPLTRAAEPATHTWNQARSELTINRTASAALSVMMNAPVRGLVLRSNAARIVARRAREHAPAAGITAQDFDNLATALEKAADNSEEFSILTSIVQPGTPIHEQQHVAQAALERFFGKTISTEDARALPFYAEGEKGALAKGYARFARDPRFIAHEIFAHVAAGQRDALGLNPRQAARFVGGYLKLIAKTYRADALNRFDQLGGLFAEVRDAIKEQTRAEEAIGAARGQRAGIPAGVSERRGGRGLAADAQERERAQAELTYRIDPSLYQRIERSLLSKGEIDADSLTPGGAHWITTDGRISANVRFHDASARAAFKGVGKIIGPVDAIVEEIGTIRVAPEKTSLNVEFGRTPTLQQLATIGKIAKNYDRFHYDIWNPETGDYEAFHHIGIPELRRQLDRIYRADLFAEVAALPPAIREAIADIARDFLAEGRTNFEELVDEFEEVLGPMYEQLADHLPLIVAEEEARLQGGESQQLAKAFSDAFAQGRSFKTIVEARQFATKILGRDIKPGTADTKMVDEALEAGVVAQARNLASQKGSEAAKYAQIVHLYERQPTLGAKTSGSVLRQAFSTPIPIAYIGSRLAGIDATKTVFEPTAGNGALLIEAAPTNIVANEIDPERAASLRASLPGAIVTEEDATTNEGVLPADVVYANPPFGAVKEGAGEAMRSKEWKIGNLYKTKEVDHAIAWKALEAMKDDGRAVLILGGINSENEAVRSDGYNGKQKRLFYYTLYQNYNVVDHFTVSGDLYQKQGAGWPIDMIVIEGRGKSKRALPAVDVPQIYKTFEQLGEKLNAPYKLSRPVGAVTTATPGVSKPGETREADRRRGGVAETTEIVRPGGVSRPVSGEGPDITGARTGTRVSGERPVPEAGVRGPSTTETGRITRGGGRAGVREPGPTGLPSTARRPGETAEEFAARQQQRQADIGVREPGTVGERPDVTAARIAAREQERTAPEAKQVKYVPSSKVDAIGTLVPQNLVTTTKEALARLKQEVGDLDAFVADRLKYDPKQIGRYFSAEQVDALALALRNMEHGAGFIIGDQTGIGKGRVVAGVIRYAIQQGRIPIFVTEKPNLYKDMYRDLTDIGMTDIKPLMTNAAQRLPLDDDESVVMRSADAKAHNGILRRMINDDSLGDHNIIFTTYSQMQTIKGAQTPRQEFLRHFAEGGIVIFDESHNAGGSEKQDDRKNEEPDRAAFARHIAALAHGVFYSSATYAKRPQVMDLYFTTDMRLAVGNDIKALAPAIAQGGVPLQQIVASMLTEAGQYIRRERSFDGVNYDTRIAPVDKAAAESVSAVMRAIQDFDAVKGEAAQTMKKQLKAEAAAMGFDSSTGATGVQSTNFTSIMHNLIDQMLLSLKMDSAVTEAVDALKRGEKPVITVANTMGSFIQSYAEDNDLRPGDALGLNFGNLLKRYLERSRDVIVGKPYQAKTRHHLTDEELGAAGVHFYKQVREAIDNTDWSNMPISPIDYLKNKLQDLGYRIGEITGRKHTVDYSNPKMGPTYNLRSDKEINTAGRNKTITGFNSGALDALIINQAGSTGLSLHASEKFKDRKKRFMVIAQPERNIDTHMQLLGRIHRTGQVVTPNYVQLVADIPAEKRPAAVLAKKMASLNANTTASRGGALTAKDVVDFMNEYGDEVAAAILEDDPDLHRRLGSPLKDNETGTGLSREDAIRRATGRIPLLPIKEQEALYSQIEGEYTDLVTRLEAMGENTLEAKTLELDAKPIDRTPVFEGVGGRSPFAQGAVAERMDVKRLGKPMTKAQILDTLKLHFKQEQTPTLSDLKRLGKQQVDETIKDLRDRFIPYKQDALDQIENADRRAAQETKLTGIGNQLAGIIREFPVGQTVQLSTEQGQFYGMVMKVEQKGKPKNPAALGSWRFNIAVADGMRQITIPASKILQTVAPDIFAAKGTVIINRADTVEEQDDMPVLDYFDHAQTESRENRIMITGNLLAGFSRFKKGQIANFRDNQGNIRQGILMPRSFNLETAMEAEPETFATADQVMKFLDTGDRLVETGDGVMKISQRYGKFYFNVPASKAVGGRYFLNPVLLEAADAEFIKSGQYMRIVTEQRVSAERLIKALLDSGEALQTRSYKEAARAITGRAAPQTVKAPKQTTRTAPTQDIEQLAARVDTMSPEELEAAAKQVEDEIARQVKEGERIAKNCEETGGRFTIKRD